MVSVVITRRDAVRMKTTDGADSRSDQTVTESEYNSDPANPKNFLGIFI